MWFCMCMLGGSLVGEMNVSFVVVVECVGGLCGSCLIRVTSMHYIKSIRMFQNEVTSPEYAILIRVLLPSFLALTLNELGPK